RRCPTIGARRLNRHGLEHAMRLGLAGTEAGGAGQVGEERVAPGRAFQRYRRGAARHPQVARFAVLARERAMPRRTDRMRGCFGPRDPGSAAAWLLRPRARAGWYYP